MPRRNKTQKIARQPYLPAESAMHKKRFASKQAAENAIKELQKYHLDLELHVYQSQVDGSWYLTSGNAS